MDFLWSWIYRLEFPWEYKEQWFPLGLTTFIEYSVHSLWSFQVAIVVKNLPANEGAIKMQVQSLGQEEPPEKVMAAHSSILVWRIPWAEEPGGLQSMGLRRVGHNWSDLPCTHVAFFYQSFPHLVCNSFFSFLSTIFSSFTYVQTILISTVYCYAIIPDKSVCLFVKMKVAQSRLTLCDPVDYTVHGILQARTLEWVALPFSRGSSQARDWTQVSCITGRFLTSWVPGKPPSAYAYIHTHKYRGVPLKCSGFGSRH